MGIARKFVRKARQDVIASNLTLLANIVQKINSRLAAVEAKLKESKEVESNKESKDV